MAMWAAGLAGGAGAVAWWRIAGPGFLWLAGGIAALLAVLALAAGAGPVAALGAGALLAGGTLAWRPAWAAPALLAGGATLFGLAAALGGTVPALTGSAALGGITAEMMLGHWYLVDPRLPRWALRRLAILGGVGMLADLVYLATRGAWPQGGPEGVAGWAFLALGVLTVLLMAAVWAALGERGYPAVMAATGLSYLAVLTALGATALGRAAL